MSREINTWLQMLYMYCLFAFMCNLGAYPVLTCPAVKQKYSNSKLVNVSEICFFSFLLAAPSAPTIISLISTYSDQLTVTWTSVPTATSYNVSINDSVNTLVPIPSTGAPQYTFTGLTSNTVYTVSVVAINCAGSSSPATITGRTGIHKIKFNFFEWEMLFRALC